MGLLKILNAGRCSRSPRTFLAGRMLAVTSAVWPWVILPILPSRVPVRFRWEGHPDRWGSPLEYAGCTTVLVALLAGALYGFPSQIERWPARWISLPHREWWWAPERRSLAAEKIRALMDRFALVTWAFIWFTQIQLTLAALAEPPRLSTRWMMIGLSLYMGAIAAWLRTWWREFRVPSAVPTP